MNTARPMLPARWIEPGAVVPVTPDTVALLLSIVRASLEAAPSVEAPHAAATVSEAADMVLVPREPTEAMCRAGEFCEGSSSDKPFIGGAYTPENVELIYKAMLAAAPGVK